MAKDPAFLFYSADFQTGTQFFTDEQTGKYIRLLCAQHLHGHLSSKMMIKICGTHDEDVFSKFKKDRDGNYYNERLEIEFLKRKNYSQSRATNRQSKNKGKKDMKNISKSYVQHMENININEDINTNNSINTNTWDSIKLNFHNDFRWKEKFCRDKNIQIVDLEKKMVEFINDIELKEDYKQLKDLKSHFLNTYNKQNGKSHQPAHGSKLGTSAARIEALKKW